VCALIGRARRRTQGRTSPAARTQDLQTPDGRQVPVRGPRTLADGSQTARRSERPVPRGHRAGG
jgi:hypothetical protein